ncbi:hypothetical protein F4808DRAFT_433227 [Astrocystis sublimbata]|nr:hypothetical protein F4808DRAFT_433227 [Astrocystis sublimbata]
MYPPKCKDIDMVDFRHITDFFVSYNSDRMSCVTKGFSRDSSIQGVRINCQGDRQLLNKPLFEEVKLPDFHHIFDKDEHDTSDIAERVGIPILTKRCFPHPLWATTQATGMYINQEATFLHMCCDPNVKFDLSRGILGWGFASRDWQGGVGSVMVVRKDKKPLWKWHVEALCRYSRNEAREWLAHSLGDYAPAEPMSKDQVLSKISRTTFAASWSKMCNEKHEKGEHSDAPSPYEV